MTASISVQPAAATPQVPTVSVSADVAKTYADAVAEAKAEVLAAEAALKGGAAKVEATAKSWLGANWQHVVTWGLAGAAGADKLLSLIKLI